MILYSEAEEEGGMMEDERYMIRLDVNGNNVG